jgi:molybdate transport system substrate-binding protein
VRSLWTLLVVTALLVAALPASAAPKTKPQPTSFAMLASDSLTEVMAELLRVYARQSGQTVTAIFGAPDELSSAILAGDPADLIILEHPGLLKQLNQQGLLDVSSQTVVAGNRLVFAASANHRLARQYPAPVALDALLKDYRELEVVMADPETLPSGIAAQEALTKQGVWKRIKPALVRAGSSRDALTLVAKGERSGVLYATETNANPEVAILAEIPPALHSPLRYQGVVVAGDDMPQAREFLAFLKTMKAREIFASHGFSIPDGAEKPE